MNKPIIIIGAGDHAKVLLDILLEQKEKVIGLIDNNVPIGTKIYDIPIIGDDDSICRYAPQEIMLVNGIGSIKSLDLRIKVFNSYREKGYSFASVIHRSAIVSKRAILEDGVQILPGVIVNTEAHIGANSIINTKTSVDHGCIIGKHVHIAPGCTLSGCVTIGDGTHIGTGSSIIQGIKIGKNVLVGAGSVVINNFEDGVKICGIPAKKMR